LKLSREEHDNEPLEAWQRTWQAMTTVLEGAGGFEIWVTSDHGYIYRGPNYTDRFYAHQS